MDISWWEQPFLGWVGRYLIAQISAPEKWELEERLARIAEVISDGRTFDLYARILKTWTTSSKNGIRLLDQGNYVVSFKREKNKATVFLDIKRNSFIYWHSSYSTRVPLEVIHGFLLCQVLVLLADVVTTWGGVLEGLLTLYSVSGCLMPNKHFKHNTKNETELSIFSLTPAWNI